MMRFFIFLLSLILPLGAPLYESSKSDNGFTYTIIDDRVTITGFEGTPESIVIPQKIEGFPVSAVRDNAFYKCTSLKEISLPEGITTLGHHCFYQCSSLEKITLPDSISEIGMGCFEDCTILTEVQFPESLTVLSDSCFRNCSSLREATLPASAEKIEKFCFSGCEKLSVVRINEELHEIGEFAFFDCPGLTELHIPSAVRNIGVGAVGYVSENGSASLSEEFVIIGKTGSAAEEYARENDLPFSGYTDTLASVTDENNGVQPVKLPKFFIAAALFCLVAALISSLILSKKR